MNDITALMATMKAAAEKAIADEGLTWWSEEQLASDYGLSLHPADAKFIALASHENVLALVEALEKAHLEISSANRMMKAQDQELITRRQRIASLESRTVTVKLPEPFKLAKSSSGLTYYYADEVNEVLTAQGIKWEAE